MSAKRHFLIFLLLLIVLMLFYGINNYIWLTKNTVVPYSESEALHSNIMLTHYYSKLTGSEIISSIRTGPYCPLYHLSTAFINKIFGISMLNTKMLNLLWFLLSLIGIYYLSKETFGENLGLWAMLIFACFPIVYGSSRMFLESFGLMSLMPITIYLMFKTQRFKDNLYSFFFAIFLALCLLTKKSAIVFLGLPVIYSIVDALKLRQAVKARRKNVFIFSAIVIAIISVKYLDINYLSFLLHVPFEEPAVYQTIYEHYFKLFIVGIVNYQISLPFFLMFFFGLIRFRTSIVESHRKVVYYFWIFFPVIFFNFIPHGQMLRIILPYLPAVAIITSFALISLSNSIKRRALSLLVICVALIQFYDFSFDIGLGLENIKFKINNKVIPYFYCDNTQGPQSLNMRAKDNHEYVALAEGILGYDIANPMIMSYFNESSPSKINNYFLFNYPHVKVHDMTIGYVFFEDLLNNLETVDFIILDQDVKKDFLSYLEKSIKILNYNFLAHHNPVESAKINNFLQDENYIEYKEKLSQIFLKFKLKDEYIVEGNHFYLYTKYKGLST